MAITTRSQSYNEMRDPISPESTTSSDLSLDIVEIIEEQPIAPIEGIELYLQRQDDNIIKLKNSYKELQKEINTIKKRMEFYQYYININTLKLEHYLKKRRNAKVLAVILKLKESIETNNLGLQLSERDLSLKTSVLSNFDYLQKRLNIAKEVVFQLEHLTNITTGMTSLNVS